MIIKEKQKLINFLNNQKVGIIPTDTIFGFVTSWKNFPGIDHIYHLKKRSYQKKIPLLVASFSQLAIFIDVTDEIKNFVINIKEPTTIIYQLKKNFRSCYVKSFFALETIAIRFIKEKWLQEIILKSGPLAATSCNISNQKTLLKFDEIKRWEKDVDFIFNKNVKSNQIASKIIIWKNKKIIR